MSFTVGYLLNGQPHLLLLIMLRIIPRTPTDSHCSGIDRMGKLAMRAFSSTTDLIKSSI